MGSVPFAFSIHQFVSSVGSGVGFASIVGLAILVLLYFAQARETAGLREQAYEALQRVEQLEAQLAHLARQGSAPPPAGGPAAPAAFGAPVPARVALHNSAAAPPAATAAGRGTRTAGAPPGPPAGVAAPALAAATRLIPAGAAAAAGISAGRPRVPRAEETMVRAAALEAASAPVGAGISGRAPSRVGGPGHAVGSPASIGPATVAGATNGAAPDRAAPPPVGARVAEEPAQGGSRPSSPSNGPRGPFLPPPGQAIRSLPAKLPAALVGLLLAGAAVGVLLILTSGSGGNPATASASKTTNAPGAGHPKPVSSFNPATVKVAVLNGTATPGLAARTSRRLIAAGYKPGTVATATDQTMTSSVVAYMPGFRNDALRVAASLRRSRASVQPVDQNARAVACPPPGACTANVVVTVGTDLASS